MLIVANHCAVQRAEISLGVEMSAKSYFGKNHCGQEARGQQLTTSVWLFRATLFGFDLESHGETGLLSQTFFLIQEVCKTRE